MGTVTCGEKLHTPVPEPKSCESWELVVPIEAVKLMVGKNAARAAPILAFAAFNVCSASRMSGRRPRRSEGRPGRNVLKQIGVIERPGCWQVSRKRLADQQHEVIFRLGKLALIGQHIDLRGLHLSFRRAQIQFIAGSGVKRGLVEIIGVLHGLPMSAAPDGVAPPPDAG